MLVNCGCGKQYDDATHSAQCPDHVERENEPVHQTAASTLPKPAAADGFFTPEELAAMSHGDLLELLLTIKTPSKDDLVQSILHAQDEKRREAAPPPVPNA